MHVCTQAVSAVCSYVVLFSVNMTCQLGGKWSLDEFPKCERKFNKFSTKLSLQVFVVDAFSINIIQFYIYNSIVNIICNDILDLL